MNKTKIYIIQALVVALFICGVSVQMAAAQGSKDALNVAVLNLEGPKVDPQLLDTLTSVLRNEAQQFSSYDIVNQSAINLSEVAIVLGCDSDSLPCLGRAAEQLDARVLIFGRVEVLENTHRVTVAIFDAKSGKIVRQLVRTLADGKPGSGGEEAGDPVSSFRKEVQTLFPRNANPVAENQATLLQIESNVEKTQIKLNGTVVGVAPVERSSLPPGIYDIEASRDGYTTWKTKVELIAGADVRVWAPMTRAPGASADALAKKDGFDGTKAVTPPPATSSSGPNWGAWSAIGVGGVALAGSGVMALMMKSTEDELNDLDTNRDGMDRDAYINERQSIVDTGESYELAHRVLLGAGAVSVVAGVVWLLVDGGSESQSAQKTDDSTWEVGLSGRGVQAQWSW